MPRTAFHGAGRILPINRRFYFFNESASFAFSTMCSASSPNRCKSSTAGPDFPKVSSTPSFTTGTGYSSQTASETALPKPPIMLCSSAVTMQPVFLAAAITASLSSGLIVAILIRLTEMPSLSRIFAASTASATRSPVAITVTSVPSLRVTALPISNL